MGNEIKMKKEIQRENEKKKKNNRIVQSQFTNKSFG